MIEKLFKNSRYLVFLTIMVSLVSSVTLYMASLNIIFHIPVSYTHLRAHET